MSIAASMKTIIEGIEVSYGERMAFLSDLFRETRGTLKTFQREQEKMATDLWDLLSSDRTSREKAVSALRGKNKRELKALAENLADLLKESTSAMKKGTAKLMAQIGEEISSMEKEIASLLSRFGKERQSMGREVKKELASTTKGRIEEVKKMLATFSAEHEGRGKELRHQLSSFQRELESAVKEMREPVVRDLKEAKQSWQNLAKIMAAKRAGKAVTVAKKIEGVPKKEVTKAVEAFSAGDLKEQILRLISEATSGITLTKMGKALGIPYVRLAKPASELVNEGKIKKEDSEYFKV